jgi:hypothetical protein
VMLNGQIEIVILYSPFDPYKLFHCLRFNTSAT